MGDGFNHPKCVVLAYTTPDRRGNRVPVTFNAAADVFVDREEEDHSD